MQLINLLLIVSIIIPLSIMKSKIKRIAIFASGSGSNAEKIIENFKDRDDIRVETVYSNRKKAGVLERAEKHSIKHITFSKSEFYESDYIINDLKKRKIDLIVLAGFLLLIPEKMIEAFPQRIVNIHPSLLPKYGGEGMYGSHVHRAVSESGDSETGITVHFVNQEYDKGKIISQVRCIIKPNDSPESIAAEVLRVEHQYYPLIIDQLLENKYYSGS